ncbi:uroporphyrinogen decarboxylase family protein [[Eubacterium] cellulosolvens]
MLKTLQLQKPDRVPVIPFIIAFAAKYAGIKFIDYCHDAKRIATAQAVTAKHFQIDAVYVDSDPIIEIEAIGAKVNYYEDEVPAVAKPHIQSLEDIVSLKMPDPQKAGRLPVWLEATRILKRIVGDERAVFTNINGPFQIAAQLRGITDICIDFYQNPQMVTKLLEFTTELAKTFVEAQVEAGTDAIVMGEAMSSPNLISPTQFEQYVLPHIRDIIETEKSVPFFLHICGDSTLIIDKMVKTGARFLEVDTPVDLAKIRERYGNKIGIRGNVSTTLLLNGGPDEVEESCQKSIEAAAKGGGFILGSGCELPKNTPHRNLEAMVAAARKYGRYHP